jgi:trimethylamine:corrinoid methyltransferase-like protein
LRDYVSPRLISQDQYDAWRARGGDTLLERTAERTRELREAPRAYTLGDEAAAALDGLVEKARLTLGAA